MRPESRSLLFDVHAATSRITEFIAGVDASQYAHDALRRSAVERQLEIVGEALKNLRAVDAATAGAIPDLSRIVGLRNVLAHGYAVVDDSIVWAAATTRVPNLRRVVEELIADEL